MFVQVKKLNGKDIYILYDTEADPEKGGISKLICKIKKTHNIIDITS